METLIAVALAAIVGICALRGGTHTKADITVMNGPATVAVHLDRTSFLTRTEIPLVSAGTNGVQMNGLTTDGGAQAMAEAISAAMAAKVKP